MEKKLALCIGINDYPGTGSDLSGCVNDANDWGKVLNQNGFAVTKLLDKEATRKNIQDALRSHVSQAVKGDFIIFQYSGHGTYIPDIDNDELDGTDECLCPYDLHSKGPISDALETLKHLKAGAAYQDWYKAIRKILPSQQYPQSPNMYGSRAMKKWKIFS